MNTKFQVGATYQTRSACDYDCIFSFTVVARSEKSIVVQYRDQTVRRAVKMMDGREHCFPMGKYSMAPIIDAGKMAA